MKSLPPLRIFSFGLLIGMMIASGIFWWPYNTSIYRNDLLLVFRELTVGATANEVARTIISIVKKAEFSTAKSGNNIRWYISSPSEFLQGQWVLVICIQDDLITGARFGIGDDVTVESSAAPAPLGTCNAR